MIIDGKLIPNMGVIVGFPCSRLWVPECSIAIASQSWPINTNVCYIPIHCENPKTGSKGPTRDKARELIAESALQLNAPYLWFIDDDVEIPQGACRQLLKTLRSAPADVMAVGGVYPAKRNPLEPVVFKTNGEGPFYNWEKDEIFPVSLIGTGCMMIKTEVFQHLEKPWFKDVDTDMLQITDDAWFCGQLEAKGFRVLADGHVLCTHWDADTMTPYRLEDSFFAEKAALV